MDPFDLAVIGGGPAGLQAALKGALLHKRVVLFDKGRKFSRIFYAPRVANIPSRPEAPRGSQLIKEGYQLIERTNKELGDLVTVHEKTAVSEVVRDGEHFVLTSDAGEVRAKVIVLATGVVDRQPWIGPEDYDIGPILPYANKGLVDYCLLCDGHTVIGKKVVVIGIDAAAAGIGRSLRDTFDADITLAACIACVTGEPDHDEAAHGSLMERAEKWGFPVLDITIDAIEGIREDKVVLVDSEGKRHEFEKAFLSFGWFEVNNAIAVALGGGTAPDGTLYTDEDCQVLDGPRGQAIGGVYAIGDIRNETWNQVPSAWADGETAVIHAWATHL